MTTDANRSPVTLDDRLTAELREEELERVSASDDTDQETTDISEDRSSPSLIEASTRDVLSAIQNWDGLGKSVLSTWRHPRLEADFDIKSIHPEVWNRLTKESTKRIRPKGSNTYIQEVDGPELMIRTILNGCIKPDFGDKDFIRSVAERDPDLDPTKARAIDAINSILLPGEIQKLVEEIQGLSGFSNDDIEQGISDLKEVS